jgi:hypothetical protein
VPPSRNEEPFSMVEIIRLLNGANFDIKANIEPVQETGLD